MSFNELKKGDALYVFTNFKGRKTTDQEIVKSIRKKNKKLEILTDEEYWYIPEEFENDCCRVIRQGQLEIHLCSDYSYFSEIYEK